MNYYSRNSPVRKRINPPPGFLMSNHSSRSKSKNGKQSIKSHFDLQQHRSTFEAKFNNSNNNQSSISSQILVIDDDYQYVPENDQILIKDLQQQDQKIQQFQQCQRIQSGLQPNLVNLRQQYSPEEQIKQIQNQQKMLNKYSEAEIGKKTSFSSNQKQHLEPDDCKQIFRSFSFGDKQFASKKKAIENKSNWNQAINSFSLQKQIERNQQSKQFFHQPNQFTNSQNIVIQGPLRLENKSRTHFQEKKQKIKIVKNTLQARSCTIKKIDPEQSWNKILKNFIRKRQKSLPNIAHGDSQPSQNCSNQQNINITGQNQQLAAGVIQDENDTSTSQQSGYFKIGTNIQIPVMIKKQGAINNKINHNQSPVQAKALKQSHKYPVQHQIKIQQSEWLGNMRNNAVHHNSGIDTKAKQHPQARDRREIKHIKQDQKHVEIQNKVQFKAQAYQKSIQLIQRLLNFLPQRLIPAYSSMHGQLVKKQHDYYVTQRRMNQTKQMLQMLIESHNKMLYVDQYLLDQKFGAQTEMLQNQQKVVINRQIIFALIRRLSSI